MNSIAAAVQLGERIEASCDKNRSPDDYPFLVLLFWPTSDFVPFLP